MSQAGQISSGSGPGPGPTVITFVTNAQSPFTTTDQNQLVSVDSTAPGNATTTIIIPAASVAGREIIIKDRTGVASTNNILVTAGGTLIDGQVTYTMAGNYDSITLIFDGTGWEII